MPFTDTEIANFTLAHLGSTVQIAALDTENSKEARILRAFWDIAYKKALKDFNWPFSKKTADLNLITDSSDTTHPTSVWTYQYGYPADCLKIRRIVSGERFDSADSQVKFELAYGDTGTVVYTDQDEAQVEYTKDVDDTSRWPDDFVMAHSYYLAHLCAPGILGGDAGKIGQRVLEFYLLEISKAMANALTERAEDQEPDCEMIRARDA